MLLMRYHKAPSIENIAKERGLVFSTIENHLSSFIPTGEIKLDELMNEEKAAVLMKLVKSSKFDGLSDLKSQLGDKFSYVELRMVVEEMKRGD